MASGPVCRANRPNTWLHRPACKREEKPCQLGAVHTWHIPAVATATKDGRSRLESGRWRSAARWLPERELSEKAPGVWLGSQILGVRAARQAHREHRALARLARHGHVAAHHARELAREGKAEPRPAVAPRSE